MADSSVSAIYLDAPITGTFTATRPVDIYLNGNSINGTINFNYGQVGTSSINTNATPATVTEVNVDTPNGSFVNGNNVTITTLNLNDVAGQTFINKGKIATANVKDDNARFLNQGSATVGTLNVNTTGFVTLGGNAAFNNVVVTKAGTVNVSPQTTVNTVTVTSTNATVNNNGTVKELASDEDVKVDGTGNVEGSTGSGTITGDSAADIEANNALKAINAGEGTLTDYQKIEVTGVTSRNLKSVNQAMLLASEESNLNAVEIQNLVSKVLKDATAALKAEADKFKNGSVTVAKDSGILKTPALSNGYDLNISRTSNEDVISRFGKVTPPTAETSVDLVFNIVDKTTGETVQSNTVSVLVPQSSAAAAEEAINTALSGLNAGFESKGLNFVANEQGTAFDLNATKEDLEKLSGTGFFTTLVDKGVTQTKVNGDLKTISTEAGTVAVDAGGAKSAIITSLTKDGSVKITVVLPYGDGSKTTDVDYTINFTATLGE